MTDYVVRDTQLTSVADAIRTKGGTSDPLAFPDGFVSAVQAFPDAVTLDSLSVTENGVYTPSSGHAFSEVTVNVSGGGGDTDGEDALITRTVSAYTNSRVTSIGTYAFAYCRNLASVDFPACTVIGESAFILCDKLTAVNIPACTIISTYAFYMCSSLVTVSFPACTALPGGSQFRACRMLLSAYFLGSRVPTLGNSHIFSSTPISGYTTYTSGVLGSIFVRASLLTAFQTAARWSYYSSRIVGLTDEEIAALDAQEGA